MVLMPPNLGVSFHYILNVVVRSIRLEYMSIPHGAPAPLMREQGHISNAIHWHFKCDSVISLEYQYGIEYTSCTPYIATKLRENGLATYNLYTVVYTGILR